MKAALLVVCIVFSKANATDLGQLGKSYPIAEEDFIEIIKNKIHEKRESGELAKFHQEWSENAKGYVKRPPGKTLPSATTYRVFAIDPTYTVQSDIKDAEGRVIYKKGFTFNPLIVKPLTKTLCFINGDIKEQVDWLEEKCPNPVSFKRILVSGNYDKISNTTKSRIYFDLNGYLISHFRIEALPAVVRQSGELLYVEEFDI